MVLVLDSGHLLMHGFPLTALKTRSHVSSCTVPGQIQPNIGESRSWAQAFRQVCLRRQKAYLYSFQERFLSETAGELLTRLFPSDTGHFELCKLAESWRRFSCSSGLFGKRLMLAYTWATHRRGRDPTPCFWQHHRGDQRGTLESDCTLDHDEALDTSKWGKSRGSLVMFARLLGIWSLSRLSKKLQKRNNNHRNHIRRDTRIYLPSSSPQTLGRISRICEHTESSEHNWRAVRQLRAALEGPGVTKPAIVYNRM